MKLNPETVDAMRAKIAPLDTEETRTAYREGRFPRSDAWQDLDKRYRWDLLWAARAHPGYPEGVTDVHVDTALRAIVPPL